MPTADKCHAQSSARPRVTDVVERHHAGAVEVCKAGEIVALHFATQAGIVVVTLDLGEFVGKCRAALDANGHPLPMPSPARRDPAEIAPPPPAPPPAPVVSPEERAFRSMIAAKKAGPSTSWAALAARHDVRLPEFFEWLAAEEKKGAA